MVLENLFSPFSISTLKINNRIVMPPMATNYASTEGFVTQRLIDYYVERAQGGVGYLNVEHTGISQRGKASPKMLLISTDEHAARISKQVEAVHDAGGKIVVQINHAARRFPPRGESNGMGKTDRDSCVELPGPADREDDREVLAHDQRDQDGDHWLRPGFPRGTRTSHCVGQAGVRNIL